MQLYTLGTGLPLREVKEGKDVGYRSQLLRFSSSS